MNYVETPPDFPYPWYMRVVFFLQRRRYGRELEPARLWGRTPRAFLAMAAMYGALDRKSSPPQGFCAAPGRLSGTRKD